MTSLLRATTPLDLRTVTAAWRSRGETIAFVPTMGALHDGHLSLVAQAKARAARAIVSIFVNPTQFAPGEDFSAYPRRLEADVETLRSARADLVFHPRVDDIYPSGFATAIDVGGPARVGLEDKFRPTHFSGVATIVAKLLILVQPDAAIFGEKDYQQLAVVRRLVRDLGLPVEIIGAETLREKDGLAMSSRNAYLSPAEREKAPALNGALIAVANRLAAGDSMEDALTLGRSMIEKAGFALDYLELRDAETLAPVSQAGGDLRLLVAARIGKTRLIDNKAVFVTPSAKRA